MKTELSTKIRTLVLDIETQPAEAFVWGLFDQNIGINMLKNVGGTMSWAAKWAGEKDMYFSSLHHSGKVPMVVNMWHLLNEADEVVGWNSQSFDTRHLNTEFIKLGLPPPSPYKQIDLMRTVKSKMRFISNKLDFVSQTLGVGKKVEHEGFELWLACMNGDKDAWARMREYNEHDVELTEKLYFKLRPWVTNNVSRAASTDGVVCTSCGSDHLHSHGTVRTRANVFKRYQCQECGTWVRSVIAEKIVKNVNRVVPAR